MALYALLNSPLRDVYQQYRRVAAAHGSLDVYFTGHAIDVEDDSVIYAFAEPVRVELLTHASFVIALCDASFRWTLRLPGTPMGRPIRTVVAGRQHTLNRFEFCLPGHPPTRGTPTHLDQATVLAARAVVNVPPRPTRETQHVPPPAPTTAPAAHPPQSPPFMQQPTVLVSHYTAIVRWHGPFTRQQIETMQPQRGRGLYLFVGRSQPQHAPQILYCGMTTGLFRARFVNHETLPLIPQDDLAIWLGIPLYPETPSASLLHRTEHMLIYCLQPVLNGSKKSAPVEATTLISYWHDAQRRPPMCSPHILPDVVSYDGTHWYKGDLAPASGFGPAARRQDEAYG